jgi:hypothetical protein
MVFSGEIEILKYIPDPNMEILGIYRKILRNKKYRKVLYQ